jgi:uncharacterized protein (TIGR02118 family)
MHRTALRAIIYLWESVPQKTEVPHGEAKRALRTPDDPDAFEQYYANTHMPLVDEIPNLQRYEAARIVATPDGSEPPYYRIFEGYFEDIEQLQSGMGTPEGQAAANDIPNFATGGATLSICEIDAVSKA